jgi:hypothetical protein
LSTRWIIVTQVKKGGNMNIKISIYIIIITLILLIGCKETDTATGVESKAALATRSWKGQSFTKLSIGDSSRVIKDIVLLFDFKNDGSCNLSQASYSVSSISGQWEIDNDGKNITLTMKRPQATVTEKLAIVDLTSSRFVFGDTTIYGYSLVPF